jgi:hypothetical protein
MDLNPITPVLLVIAYALAGADTKYVDIVSEQSPKSAKALASAVVASALMACLIFFDADSAALLFGIVLGVLAAGKLDTPALKLGASIASAGFVLALIAKQAAAANWIALPAVAAAAVLDEFLNDYADKRRLDGAKGFLLKHRVLAKAAVLALAILNVLGWIYFAAFLAFDAAYDLTGTKEARLRSQQRKTKRK